MCEIRFSHRTDCLIRFFAQDLFCKLIVGGSLAKHIMVHGCVVGMKGLVRIADKVRERDSRRELG